VATGMCKLDQLFSGKINRASVLKQFGLPGDYRYVLFAPTFNDELSAIPFVQDRIGQALPDEKTLLIIKLHPSTKPEYKEMYRALPSRDKRVIFADELDITPFLALCDVMISDVSSAMMEFAALDKPVILFNNPNWTSYQNYNPTDIEFQWRDIGMQVASLDEMTDAVSHALKDPGLHADKRKKYTDLLFANKREGNAAQRIVKLALSLLEAEQKR
jgi:CDP-glycerol glycerophosphotransferase (TagB/SpsB family)